MTDDRANCPQRIEVLETELREAVGVYEAMHARCVELEALLAFACSIRKATDAGETVPPPLTAYAHKRAAAIGLFASGEPTEAYLQRAGWDDLCDVVKAAQ
ncbi:hypothetical protein HQ535_08975 [bacterium]|nr:hypothetical protein [bacterium]